MQSSSLIREKHLRQLDVFDPSRFDEIDVLIVGAGAVGSWTTLGLAKLGISSIKVMDFDTVEPHNYGPQFFNSEQCGMPKVDALAMNIKATTDLQIIPWNQEFNSTDVPHCDIIVSTVDDMDVRGQIAGYVASNEEIRFFVDARTGGQVIRIFTIPNNRDSVEQYLKNLYPNEETADIPCGQRAIIDVQFFAAGLLVRQIRKMLKEGEAEREILMDVMNLDIMEIQLLEGETMSTLTDSQRSRLKEYLTEEAAANFHGSEEGAAALEMYVDGCKGLNEMTDGELMRLIEGDLEPEDIKKIIGE